MDIKIEYSGVYPCLCMGRLKVTIDDKVWDFGQYCLSSGGTIKRDENWYMWAESGPWEVSEWPDNFPEDLKEPVLQAINEEIPWGCCGGCI
jgi:hypothetical protein